jgi:hypothetical protein
VLARACCWRVLWSVCSGDRRVCACVHRLGRRGCPHTRLCKRVALFRERAQRARVERQALVVVLHELGKVEQRGHNLWRRVAACCGVGVWCCGVEVLWCCGVVVLWCCGVVVLWCCGVVVLWCCGVVVLRCCGVVVLWCCGVVGGGRGAWRLLSSGPRGSTMPHRRGDTEDSSHKHSCKAHTHTHTRHTHTQTDAHLVGWWGWRVLPPGCAQAGPGWRGRAQTSRTQSQPQTARAPSAGAPARRRRPARPARAMCKRSGGA